MKVYKATVILAASVHEVHLVDVIEYENKFWLVPEWIDNPTTQLSRPMRIIGLEKLRHDRMADSNFVVEDPIPKSVFDGQIPPGEDDKYVVLELPEILIPILPRIH